MEGRGVQGVYSSGSSDFEEVERDGEGGYSVGVEDHSEGFLFNDPLGLLQGERRGSEDGDPGELLTGSAPWEEEKAGSSAASWMAPRRGEGTVRVKASARRSHTRSGFAPTSGMVSRAKRPGHASGGEGPQAVPRRPRTPAVRVKDLIKRARLGEGWGDTDWEDAGEDERLDYDEDSVEEGARGGRVLYCRLEQVQAEAENGHMTDENEWEENKTRQRQIERGWIVAGLRK
ncbi:hypothetical protein NDU88_002274 [Pleurodeles waltl]|uniref:Uncharacterized protein n=1 Tax=Pleurodeles waltl TaxID=8319 RepID=A0AAV7R9J5_PLEWA|nr:hypothetical protein NDU88_002274 [Pleurodeles waltl]